MSIHIRIALLKDYEGVCALYAGLDAHHVDIDPSKYRAYEGPARSLDRFTELVNDSDWFFFVSEQGGVLNGFVNGFERSTRPFPFLVPRKAACIQNLYVTPSGRHLGLGQALMEAAMDWSQARDIFKLELDVHANNTPALTFYQNMGFEMTLARLDMTMEGQPSSEG